MLIMFLVAPPRFSNGKDHAAYRREFEKLLRDFKTQTPAKLSVSL
jgi:rRNA maturation protein Nop10